MSPLLPLVTLLLAMPPTTTTAHAGTPAETTSLPTRVVGDRTERAAAARTFFAQGRFVEAALEFEGLVRDFPDDPSLLLNAAISREAAGHHAHAIAGLRRLLARGDLAPDARLLGSQQLAESRRKVTKLDLAVLRPPAGPPVLNIVAHHVARGAADLRPDLSFPVVQPTMTLELDPGAWILRAEGPDYQSVEQHVVVESVPMTLTLRPQLRQASPATPAPRVVPPEVTRKAARATGITGGVIAAAGVGLLAGGLGMTGAVKTCDQDVDLCRRRFALGLAVRSVGISLLDAGVGLGMSALVWNSSDPRRRMIAWSALAAVGGVGFIVGEVLLVRSAIPFNRGNTDPSGTLADWRDHWDQHHRATPAGFAASLRGLGVGLLAGAVTGLVVQRRFLGPRGARALRVDPSAGPGQTGLVLSGQF